MKLLEPVGVFAGLETQGLNFSQDLPRFLCKTPRLAGFLLFTTKEDASNATPGRPVIGSVMRIDQDIIKPQIDDIKSNLILQIVIQIIAFIFAVMINVEPSSYTVVGTV